MITSCCATAGPRRRGRSLGTSVSGSGLHESIASARPEIGISAEKSPEMSSQSATADALMIRSNSVLYGAYDLVELDHGLALGGSRSDRRDPVVAGRGGSSQACSARPATCTRCRRP